MNKESGKGYREAIDGLGMIPVLSVILLQMGYTSNGYLGIENFFMTGGILITRITCAQYEKDTFSVTNF